MGLHLPHILPSSVIIQPAVKSSIPPCAFEVCRREIQYGLTNTQKVSSEKHLGSFRFWLLPSHWLTSILPNRPLCRPLRLPPLYGREAYRNLASHCRIHNKWASSWKHWQTRAYMKTKPHYTMPCIPEATLPMRLLLILCWSSTYWMALQNAQSALRFQYR